MMDLDPTVDSFHHPQRSRQLLFDFLGQFDEVESRWRNFYESGTNELLRQCAEYQKEILNRDPRIPADEFNQSTIIVALLRCVVITRQLSEVDGTYSRSWPVDDGRVHVFQDEGPSDYWGLRSSITVQKTPRAKKPGGDGAIRRRPRGLPMTLKRAIGCMQRLMFSRRPHDLPCLVYSLCLLALVRGGLEPLADFMSPIKEAGNEVAEILQRLCDLYLYCSEDVHPLSENYDASQYAVKVDNDPIAVKYFQLLHRLWKHMGEILYPVIEYAHTNPSIITRIQGKPSATRRILHSD